MSYMKQILSTVQPMSDDVAKARLSQDDTVAVYTAFMPMIWGLATRMVNSKGWTQDPDDLFQEASVRVLEKLGNYKPDLASVSTYVYMLSRDAMIDYLRREIKATEKWVRVDDDRVLDADGQDVMDFLCAESGHVEDMGDEERRMDLVRAANQLPESILAPLARMIHGYTVREIAADLGLSKSQTGRLIQQARDKLIALTYK